MRVDQTSSQRYQSLATEAVNRSKLAVIYIDLYTVFYM